MTHTIFILGQEGHWTNYKRAIESAGGRAVFSGDPDGATACDGLLLPGGGDLEPWRYGQSNTASHGLEPERDTAELLLLERFTAVGKPVLGICRGLQVINVFFGGTLIQDLPGHDAVDGGDRLHAVHTAPAALFGLFGEESVVNSAHHQAAGRLGSGLRVTQWALDGVIEALEHRTLPVLGVQWHPERLGANDLGARLFAAFLSRCR